MFTSVSLEDSSLFLRNTTCCFVTAFDLEASFSSTLFHENIGVFLPFLLQIGPEREGCVLIWVEVRCRCLFLLWKWQAISVANEVFGEKPSWTALFMSFSKFVSHVLAAKLNHEERLVLFLSWKYFMKILRYLVGSKFQWFYKSC